MDIVVTTPLSERVNAEAEAEWALAQGGGPNVHYFRRMGRVPQNLMLNETKVFYVEDGYVRGFCTLWAVDWGEQPSVCAATMRDWGSGAQLVMRADSWKWIKPIPMKGFQGFRYFDQPYEVVGDWQDKRPPEGITDA